MAPAVRIRLEASLGADLREVRVHQGPQAAAAAQSVGARAFTLGTDIYLGGRESPLDLALMAHEAAHVLQQQGQAVVQRMSSGGGDPYEHEAAGASAAVQSGAPFAVTQSTGGARVQRLGVDEFIENRAWSLLEEYVPELVPILRKGPEGVLDWLKQRITSAFEAMFDNLMAPVRAISGAGKWLSGHFGPLLAWMQEAAAKIARNDCSPFREAAEKIEEVATAIITPIVEKIRAVAAVVGDFFKGIWAKFGAPVWDWIKQYAGGKWDEIKRFASWVWDRTAPIRAILDRAWTWLKNKIGIGEGPEGQNGILQWVQRKAEVAWDWVKEKLEPYKKQLMTVGLVIGGILLLISPAGPVLVVGGIVVGVVQGIRWIKANWKGDVLVRARAYLEKTLIPSVMGSLNRMTAAVTRMAAALNGKLGEAAAGMGQVVNAVAGSVLRFAVSAMQWVADQVTALARWGTERLAALSQWIQTTFTRVVAFLQPYLDFLGQVAKVIADVYTLPIMLAGRAWNAIPACVRDPVVDFTVPIILRQIAIFRELVRDNEAWQKTKADVLRIVKLVFKDRDLKGAAKAVFHLILRVFNVPLELLVEVLKKAAGSWDAVMEQPIAFIKNAVRAVGHGFKLLWINKWMHLWHGVEGWLFGSLSEKGISPPKSWTNASHLLEFVLDVLGLSMNHVFELLKKRFDKGKVETLQRIYGGAKKVWGWISEIIDASKSAAEVTKGLIDKAWDFGKSILTGIVTWISVKVATELAMMAAAAAATAGISEVIDIARRIYKAIGSAVRWMRQILEMVNNALTSVLEIARGAIEPAGEKVEAAMHRAMPVVIGFLGDQVGLGGIGDKMRDLVTALREKVDAAILWLIDKVKAVLDAIVGGVKAAVGAVLEWWRKKFGFRTDDGESHTIMLDGPPDSLDVAVESKRTFLGELIGRIPKGKDALKKEAEAAQRRIRVLIAEGRQAKDPVAVENVATAMEAALADMSDVLVRAKVLDKPAALAPTYRFEPYGGRAKKALVQNLTAIRQMGSVPGTSEPPGWAFVQAIGQTTKGQWFRRLHLLNHRFGGPGMNENLAVASKTDNEHHLFRVENEVKKYVGDVPNEKGRSGVVVQYVVDVIYGRESVALEHKPSKALANLKDFPTRFECAWQVVKDPAIDTNPETAVAISFDMEPWEDVLRKYEK